VREPAVFLFDEPLSNLDAKLRVQTRREIAKLHRDLAATMIYVTHDQVEAMTLGDRIVVMNAGRVQQVDTPLVLYDRPANRFVAGFIGSPAMNFIEGAVGDPPVALRGRDQSEAWFVATDESIAVPLSGGVGTVVSRGKRLVFGVRPEDVGVSLASDGANASAGATVAMPARIELVEPLGNEAFVHAAVGANVITARSSSRRLPDVEAAVRLEIDPARGHWFDLETGDRISDPSSS
jgi:multiple sugar transport system ATP-binding protein